MVTNFLNNLKNKKNKDVNKDIEKIYPTKKKNKDNENLDINKNKKEEKRIINIFGINISIKKGISPIQNLRDLIIQKNLNPK